MTRIGSASEYAPAFIEKLASVPAARHAAPKATMQASPSPKAESCCRTACASAGQRSRLGEQHRRPAHRDHRLAGRRRARGAAGAGQRSASPTGRSAAPGRGDEVASPAGRPGDAQARPALADQPSPPRSPGKSSSKNSCSPRFAGGAPLVSACRSSTRRILPEIVFGSSANSMPADALVRAPACSRQKREDRLGESRASARSPARGSRTPWARPGASGPGSARRPPRPPPRARSARSPARTG